MATKLLGPVQHKRGTTAQCAAYTGEAGEFVLDMEAKKIYIHDGITKGGHEFGSGSSSLLVWDEAVTSDLGSHNENAYVSVSVKALSAFGNDLVTYTVRSGSIPAGLAINQFTGMLQGTLPNLAATTPYTFNIEAADGISTITRQFTITVNAVNDSPVWQTPSNLGVMIGEVSVQLVATDPDSVLTYSLTGGSLPVGLSLSNTGLLSGEVDADGQTYNFTVTASDGVNNVSRTFSALAGAAPGEAVFTTVGTHEWTVPDGVTSVCAVVIGGGGGGGSNGGRGGGGGGLAWKNDIPVTPGNTITVTVGIGGAGAPNTQYVGSNGGSSSFGSFISATGGTRGNSAIYGGSGNGAGGSGSGGDGNHKGGGGGAGSQGNNRGGGGGGVGLYGGLAGGAGGGGYSAGGGGGGAAGYQEDGGNGSNSSQNSGLGGAGGSGGENGQQNSSGGGGGIYGGGGGGSAGTGANGAQGAVRIIWGHGRSFPNNAA